MLEQVFAQQSVEKTVLEQYAHPGGPHTLYIHGCPIPGAEFITFPC